MPVIKVDVITAVHNADSTIEEAVRSAMGQEIPPGFWDDWMIKGGTPSPSGGVEGPSSTNDDDGDDGILLNVCVCCYDDASTDDSLSVLRSLSAEYGKIDDERRRRRAPDDGRPADDGDYAAAGRRDDRGRRRRLPGSTKIRTRLLIGAALSGT